MQRERDYIDEIVFNSCESIKVDEGYNNKLLSKLDSKRETNNRIQYRIAACSLILSGLLTMFVYTNNMQYKIVNTEYKLKIQALMVIDNFNINKLFLGE